MSSTPEIFFVNPNGLKAHPLLEAIPVLDEASPEFQALLASVRDRGVDYPVILDEDDRILDGRNRARAAARVGASLPAMKRSSAEAAEIICASLVNRRHLPKGALAYLAVPMFAPAVEAGRSRRLSHLKSASHRDPIQSGHGVGQTVEQLAATLGFSPDLYEQAVKVRKLFEATKVREWKDGSRKLEHTVKGWFEPKLLSGEISLGGIIQAIAGKDSTEGVEVNKRDLSTLIRRGFSDLGKRFSRWESLGVGDRRTLSREVAHEAREWPEDVRQAVLASLEEVAAHPTRKSTF